MSCLTAFVTPVFLSLSVCVCLSVRHLQVKLVKYISKQLEWKQSVPEIDRLELDSYPQLTDWLYTINLRPELIEVSIFVFVLSVFVSYFIVHISLLHDLYSSIRFLFCSVFYFIIK